jgi:histidinol-phosphate aminotransferase
MMSNIKAYVEKNTQDKVRLHANESPYNNLSRILERAQSKLSSLQINEYPSLNATSLKKRLGLKLNVSPSSLIVGNGSDELITLVMQSVCGPHDKVVTHAPTFSQYAWNASLLHLNMIEVNDKPGFEINVRGLIDACQSYDPKLLILCTPNNPTGALLSRDQLQEIIQATTCFIMVDEAYLEFVDQDYQDLVLSSNRMISLRTFSKAYGCAGIRFGYGIAQAEVIEKLNQSRQPYNVNAITQILAETIIDEEALVLDQIKRMLKSKAEIVSALTQLGCTIAPSSANFIFFTHPNIDQIEQRLYEAGFAIKSFASNPLTLGYARMSIPDEAMLPALIQALEGDSQ